MGIDKLYYLNSIELSSKALNSGLVAKSIPESEYVQLMKQSSDQLLQRL